MTAALMLGCIVLGALATRSVYRLGLTAGVRLGFDAGRAHGLGEAKALLDANVARLRSERAGAASPPTPGVRP